MVTCQLHANELNMRHLFESIDGKTSGPNLFKGEIGKCLTGDIHHKLVASYESVSGKIPHINELVIKDLSSDPESILLSMLSDKDIKVREKAVSTILNIRNSTEDPL